jgi:hypothetical protein
MRSLIVISASLLAAAAAHAAPEQGEMAGTNCGQFLGIVEMAAEKNPAPGAHASAVEAARDELIITMFWVHGFATGKAGTPPRLDKAWISNRIEKLAGICKTKGAANLPIAQAAALLP